MTRALLDHLWQSTLFCAGIWSITLALRANSAAVRHGLWLVASCKFLVPFSALHLLGAVAGLPTPVESQPISLVAAFEAATPVLSPALGLEHTVAPAGYLAFFTGVWILVSSCLALRWLRDWRAAQWLFRVARPAPGAPPGTYVTDAGLEPAVAGVFRPVVLLPAALPGRLPPAELDAVLAHEHEHIARHDVLKAQVHRLVETLFWFHPLVWFIGRQLREERERACDEAVLARGHDPGDYAAGILAVCRHCAGAHSPHAVAALAGDLTRRVRHILAARAPASLGFAKSFLLSLATLLIATGPLVAGVVDGAARRQQQVEANSRALWDADIQLSATAGSAGSKVRITASGNEIVIHDSSLRQLIALAYGVDAHAITGGGGELDAAHYDIRALVPGSVSEPERFEPAALRGMVARLLATRFNLELYVNRHCQHPCGPRALDVTGATL